MTLTPDEQSELLGLEAAFEGLGGRSVELAERIDTLHRKHDLRDLVENLGVHPNWRHWEDPGPDDTVTVTLGDQEFVLTRTSALWLMEGLRDVIGTKEVLE